MRVSDLDKLGLHDYNMLQVSLLSVHSRCCFFVAAALAVESETALRAMAEMSTKIGEIELLKPLAVGTMAWGRTWLDGKLNRGGGQLLILSVSYHPFSCTPSLSKLCVPPLTFRPPLKYVFVSC